jgi:hypothetical protein
MNDSLSSWDLITDKNLHKKCLEGLKFRKRCSQRRERFKNRENARKNLDIEAQGMFITRKLKKEVFGRE